MCGIIGYNGNKKALPILIEGLKALEYRGYDSAGVAFNEKDIKVIKEVGRISKLESILNMSEETFCGIGHTRWATHGGVNLTNSHPHQVNNITLVHNGIIENYAELKKYLLDKGYNFKTDTDTEVICALIDYLYSKNKNILQALSEVKELVVGSYALCLLVKNDDNLYCIKKDSPLTIGISDNETFVASDIQAFLKHTNKYIVLDDNDIAIIKKDGFEVYNGYKKVNHTIKEYRENCNDLELQGYDHYMQKEINEQPKIISNLFDNLMDKIPNFDNYRSIDIVACGSAYHSGLVGKNLIEEASDIETKVEIASEYRYKKIINKDKKLVIVVSQSGETADTLACLRKANENNIDTLAIVNVVDSSIAREAKQVLYLKAGTEVSVATTKAYSAQVALLSLIALNLNNSEFKKDVLKDLKKLPIYMEGLINHDYEDLAKKLYKDEDIFFIGRGIDYALAMEGSLKMKEISYIHSEAYPAGELKHGTISLISNNTPVIGIITDDKIALKTISNLKEVEARGARVITINNINYKAFNDNILIPKVNKFLQPLLTVIPLQRLAYEVAKLRNCEIDKPKNLAKSVTVE